MKKNIFLFILTIFTLKSFGQDTLKLKSNIIIISKILSVGVTEIKYKKFDNINGPEYTILKKEVQSIVYENGSVEHFNVILKEAKELTDNKVFKLYINSKRHKKAAIGLVVIGSTFMATSVAFGIVALTRQEEGFTQIILSSAITGTAFILPSIIGFSLSPALRKKADYLKNNGMSYTQPIKSKKIFEFGIGSRLSLRYKF